MEIKELILLYITIQGFVSYVPQIIRLIKTKSAEDCSITSWGIWLINSALYLLYLYLDNVNIWLKLSQLLEVLLIGTTTLLVVILRIKGRCGKHYEH
ncbi:MAG: hypothetical protein J6A59_14005 [Lachnospiraceae bacterium]|nr:hypothetical protein [Lachnospiraceae bacterium]